MEKVKLKLMDNHNHSTVKETLLRTEVPQRTKSYTPISYREIIDRTEEQINKHGFTVSESKYRTTSDGLIGQCNYNIQYGNDPDMGLMIAWQNSYNKQVSFKYAIGSSVFVCKNGVVSGDLGAYKRIHKGTADNDSFLIIEEYLKTAEEKFQKLVEMKEKMKLIEVSKRQMAEIAGRWFIEDEIITATQLGIIKREIDNPSYDYGTGNNTMWDIYNAATHSFKKDHPSTWLKRHSDLSQWTINEYGLSVPETALIYMGNAETVVEAETEEVSDTEIVFAHI